jgi:hypothetical protein
MAFNPCDLPWASLRGTCSRRVVRHKDQKGFRTCADADSESQASKEESDAHAIAYRFAKTKESLANSEPNPENQIKRQESVSDACTN